MNSIRFRSLFIGVLLLVAAATAVAQTYPLPASTPNTDVPCTKCPGRETLQTIGYPPVLNFVGRWADAETAKDYQQPFRTARPRFARAVPGKNRLYAMLGSAFAAYDLDRFFSRLSSRPQEALATAFAVPVNTGGYAMRYPDLWGPSEIFLYWDAFFYAENGGGWVTPTEDGLERLFDFDWDDRGNVYLAYSVFGWGVVKDGGQNGGGWLTSVSQTLRPMTEPDPFKKSNGLTPDHIISVKTADGHYYAAVSDKNMSSIFQVYDVQSPAAPVRQPDVAGRSFYLWAKDSTGSRIGIVDYSGLLSIYTPEEFVKNGGRPIVNIAPSTTGGYGNFKTITTDGTNFYAYGVADSGGFIDVISPAGATYREQRYPSVGYTIPQGMHYGDGYLAVYGSEAAPPYGVGAWNLHLYKVAPNSLTEISFETPIPGGGTKSFWAMYYSLASPPGYTHPFYGNMWDVLPIRVGSKTYLVVCDIGLGDVWELKSGDSITGRVKATADTPNPNSAAPAGSGPFYGDRQTFSSALSSGQVKSVTWSFGDGSSVNGVSGGDVQHQYGGVTKTTDLPLVRRATVADALDSTINDTVTVSLAAPAARFKLANTSLLFRQPDASSAAPIVVGDSFVDASDGAVEGHYSEWVLDGASTKQLPSQAFGVGGCGAHTLAFNAHYGPYSGSGNGITSTNGDLTLPISPFTYSVRPYVLTIQEPAPSTVNDANAVFTTALRVAGANDLPGGSGTAVTYKWELVNGSTVVLSTNGSATLGTIPSFNVPKTNFSTQGLRVRLTTSVAATALPGAGCSGFATSVVLSNVLNGPDPVIAKTGCTTVGLPCSYTVTSASNPTLAGWSFAWSSNPSVTSSTGSNSAEFKPQFTSTTDYTVSVTVTNGIGTSTANMLGQHIDKPACTSAPDNINMAIGIANNTGLNPGDTVSFLIFPRGWTPSVECDKFSWDFGDGSAKSTDFTPTHIYQTAGTYTATLTLTGALATNTYTATVVIGGTPTNGGGGGNPNGGGGGNPNGGGGGGSSCSAPQANSAYITYYGAGSQCTLAGGTCNPGEALAFDVMPDNGFNLACGTPTFTWNFGDGALGSGKQATHAYGAAGIYHSTLTIQNGTGSFTYQQDVRVGNVQPKQCGTLTNQNVTIGFNGTGCTETGGSCAAANIINFRASSTSYDFTCTTGTHTYDWDFGDGTAHANTANPSHTYQNAGNYNVKLTVSNGSSSGTSTRQLSVSGTGNPATGSCGTMDPEMNVYIVYFGDGCSVTGGNCNAAKAIDFRLGAYGYDPSCGVPSYSWDFGDGAKSTEVTPSHKYATNGSYNVKLTFSNGTDKVDLTRKVTVTGSTAPPVPPKHRAGGH